MIGMIESQWPARMLGLCAVTLLVGVSGPAGAQQAPAAPGLPAGPLSPRSAAAPGAAAPQDIRAQLTPRDYTTLASENAGRIDRIATRAGQHFKKGDVLVVFDCVAQQAQSAKARAVLVAAEKTFAVNRRLAQLKSIGQLELDVSEAEIEKARADVAIADAAASKCSVVAPFSGVTVEQKAREFQYTTPGQPLLEILDDRNLEVEFIAPSRWLPWLKVDYAFAIRVDETGKSYPAHITALGARVDPVSQSIKVTGAFDNPAPELISGMSGRIDIAPPSE
jgi:membrane fusion protein (multidrug efflux system)